MAARFRWKGRFAGIYWAIMVIGAGVLLSGSGSGSSFTDTEVSGISPARTDVDRLVSIVPLPEMEGPMCQWVPASTDTRLVAVLRQQPRTASAVAQSSDPDRRAEVARRRPLRVIRDPYSAYSAVAVDPARNEVVMTDENLFQILVYDRLENTPPTATMSEPKRIIGGHNTRIEFQCGLYIDPKNGDIFAVNNDTLNTLVIFSRQARGDVPPDRKLATPHGTFGIAVDERNQELFLTVQIDNAVVVFRKMAEEEEAPIRLLQGDRTRLADPHGIALDAKNDLIFVANYGASRQHRTGAGRGAGTLGMGRGKANWPLGEDRVIPGSGRSSPPSITVYSRTAEGNTAPLRVIEGPKTQLNWPAGIAVEPERGELFVANDMGDSILVFDASASGDVAPIRVLKGPNSGIKNPTGLFLDTENDELWVSNFGNHSATVYPLTVEGDTPPLRTIRSSPQGVPSLMIGNPGSLAYDSNREEILVPN